MTDETNQEKKVNCTSVQSIPWHQTDLIVRNITTFLGPKDLSNFRLVCQKWKDGASPIWKYLRTRDILRRYSKLGIKSAKALHDYSAQKADVKPLTVFSGHRSLENDFDSVWADELQDFFSKAERDDAQLKETSFLVINLKKWNRFGNFIPREQEGAKWFLNEMANKVVHLTFDKCNFSISQGEFFPALCRMTKLKELIIRETCFQLRPSNPVQPTSAEIVPLHNLKVLEVNYSNCTEKNMPNYSFPWELFLSATPSLKVIIISFSNLTNLNFAIHQFAKMIVIPNSVRGNIFRNIADPKQEPIIPKWKVLEIVQKSLDQLSIGSSTIQSIQQTLPPNLPFSSDFKLNSLFALVQNRFIGIKFQDHKDDPAIRDIGFAMDLFLELHEVNFEYQPI